MMVRILPSFLAFLVKIIESGMSESNSDVTDGETGVSSFSVGFGSELG